MTAYTATYATGDVQSVIVDMIVGIFAGVNLQALVLGAAIVLFIVLKMYTKVFDTALGAIRKLMHWGN